MTSSHWTASSLRTWTTLLSAQHRFSRRRVLRPRGLAKSWQRMVMTSCSSYLQIQLAQPRLRPRPLRRSQLPSGRDPSPQPRLARPGPT